MFAYEGGSFVQKWKVDARVGDSDDCRVRGTFIGDAFYLLKENGNVRSYRMDSGELLEEIP